MCSEKVATKIAKKIALIGASGQIGSRILDEALQRGHVVTGIVRNADRLPDHERLQPAAADIADVPTAVSHVRDADVLVVSIRWQDNADQVLQLARQANVRRLIAIVGAGSLEVRPGVRVIDAPEFPPAWRPGAEQATAALDTLRREASLDWVAVSPSWSVAAGERTGKFRIGADQLLRDERGDSRISREDFAVAVLNEIEQPRHHRQRITVGY
ncbi:MAG: NAD(P)H-binding protein [Steroidobacteraceae bacterium]